MSKFNLSPSAYALLMALLFSVFIVLYVPFRETFQFDVRDEGNALMRALLLNDGYKLYAEISSDQPPLFAQALKVVLLLSNNSLTAARLFVLLHAALIVYFSTYILASETGKISASIFTVLYAVSPNFSQLSVSVMIGLPSLTYAIAGFWLVYLWSKNQKNIYLVLIGFALAISFWTKIISALTFPCILLVIALQLRNRPGQFTMQLVRSFMIVGGTFLSFSTLIILVFVGPEYLSRLILPHLTAAQSSSFGDTIRASIKYYSFFLYLIPMILIAIPLIYAQRKYMLYAYMLWIGINLVVFWNYSPFWSHYLIIVIYPFLMLIAAAVGQIVSQAGRSEKPALMSALLSLMMLFSWAYIYSAASSLHARRAAEIESGALSGQGNLMVKDMILFKEHANFVLVEQNMYAFRSGIPVPPPTATFSLKLINSKQITADKISSIINVYRPEMILVGPLLTDLLPNEFEGEYSIYSQHYGQSLYVRRDVVGKVEPGD